MNRTFLGEWVYLGVQGRNNTGTTKAHAQPAVCANEVKKHNWCFCSTVWNYQNQNVCYYQSWKLSNSYVLYTLPYSNLLGHQFTVLTNTFLLHLQHQNRRALCIVVLAACNQALRIKILPHWDQVSLLKSFPETQKNADHYKTKTHLDSDTWRLTSSP